MTVGEMMKTGRGRTKAAEVRLGYAADERGTGVAYALLDQAGREALVRVAFTVRRLSGLDGREITYGALAAVAGALRARGFGAVTIALADELAVAELEGHRPIPPALGMPYVTVRCALNGLSSSRVRAVERGRVIDLESRARAEVSLHVAA
jgi:hypothetical protein